MSQQLTNPDFAVLLCGDRTLRFTKIQDLVVSDPNYKNITFAVGISTPGFFMQSKAKAWEDLNTFGGREIFPENFTLFLEKAKKELSCDVVIVDNGPSFFGAASATLQYCLENNGTPVFVFTLDAHDLSGIATHFDFMRYAVYLNSKDIWIVNKIQREKGHKCLPSDFQKILENHPGLTQYLAVSKHEGIKCKTGKDFWEGILPEQVISIPFSQEIATLWDIEKNGFPSARRLKSVLLKITEKRLDYLWEQLGYQSLSAKSL